MGPAAELPATELCWRHVGGKGASNTCINSIAACHCSLLQHYFWVQIGPMRLLAVQIQPGGVNASELVRNNRCILPSSSTPSPLLKWPKSMFVWFGFYWSTAQLHPQICLKVWEISSLYNCIVRHMRKIKRDGEERELCCRGMLAERPGINSHLVKKDKIEGQNRLKMQIFIISGTCRHPNKL